MAQAHRTFRIFVSSTFTDLREERNALQRHVFPALKRLCLTHGARFQAIDLRWGVRQEASLDHRTMPICLDEIDRCRRASPRPNFVVLLGDRYGWRPVPAAIPAREYERLLSKVALGPDIELLRAWYEQDDNAVPSEYRLRPREVPPGGTPEGEQAGWTSVEASLRRILTSAAERASLADDDRLKYEASATEQEIQFGAMRVADAGEHVFGYFRRITNSEHLLSDLQADMPEEDRAGNFVDLRTDGSLDAEAAARMDRLKGDLERALPDHVHHYETQWIGRNGVSFGVAEAQSRAVVDALATALRDEEKAAVASGFDPAAVERLRIVRERELRSQAGASAAHDDGRRSVIVPDHIPSLCADVFLDLALVISRELARLKEQDPVEKDIADHDAFAADRAKTFIGRVETLRTATDYAAGGQARPLVLYGPSGVGKSAVMARAAERMREAQPRTSIVQRFIGATPGSSDIRTLLSGLCHQISRVYGADEATIPSDYRSLVDEWPKRLALSTAAQPLVVVIDALDQLSDADQGRQLTWLPAILPDHSRLIVSTLPGECLSALERKLPADSLTEIAPMPREEAGTLLDLWLTAARRTLQRSQRKEVLDKFSSSAQPERGGLPLYLKLAFEEARHWTSGGTHRPLSADVPGVIRDLFTRLSDDASHGSTMVSRSLAYIAAARNGLSEDELIDVLTMDPDVFDDFERRARHAPPERRLPVVVWSRLFFDVEPYLTERAADGASLLTFYHRQLREVAEQDYLASGDKESRHRLLAAYFAGRPLFDEGTPHLRKLSELPYQQTHATLWDDLYATLTDFDFLEAKCTYVAAVTEGSGDSARTVYGGVYELQEDYRRALEKLPAS